MQDIWEGKVGKAFTSISNELLTFSRRRWEAGGLFYSAHKTDNQNSFLKFCHLTETGLF